MRALCSTVLVFQAIVIGLAVPVAIAVYGADPTTAWWVAGGLWAGCLAVIVLLRFRWALALGWVLQAATIACGLVVPAMAVLGVMFAALWWGAIRLGSMERPA